MEFKLSQSKLNLNSINRKVKKLNECKQEDELRILIDSIIHELDNYLWDNGKPIRCMPNR